MIIVNEIQEPCIHLFLIKHFILLKAFHSEFSYVEGGLQIKPLIL